MTGGPSPSFSAAASVSGSRSTWTVTAAEYKGKKMEEADVLSLFENPQHPYTKALLAALPENATGDRLPTVSAAAFEEVLQ